MLTATLGGPRWYLFGHAQHPVLVLNNNHSRGIFQVVGGRDLAGGREEVGIGLDSAELRWSYFTNQVFESLDASRVQEELGLTEMVANKPASSSLNQLALH
jgi:hypothetical protein